MKKLLVASAALAAMLTGCQTTDQGSGVQQGVSVTRFHLGQPVARGEIRVEPADPSRSDSLQFRQEAAAVEQELARLGWTIARADPRSEQVALVHVEQGSREAIAQRSGLSIGLGGGSGGWRGGGVGVGVGATIPVGSRSNEIHVTELSVRIQRRSDSTVAWEGRAQIEARAGTPAASPGEAVARLAEALFRDFPGESGRTIRLR